jgi:hypothetical protein
VRLSIRFLGLDFLTIEASTDEDMPAEDVDRDLSGGTTAAMPMGFTPSWGDQAWESGVER